MYAKNVSTPPKFNFPYQEQQRYSGSLIIRPKSEHSEKLSEDAVRKITASAKKLETAQD